MQRWEYKLVHGRRLEEKAVNALGDDGWELVAVVQNMTFDSQIIYSFVFKRPVEEEKSSAASAKR